MVHQRSVLVQTNSASLSHLLLSLNQMDLSFLASDFLGRFSAWFRRYLPSKKTARKTADATERSANSIEGKSVRSWGAAPAEHRINTNLSGSCAICACQGGTRTKVNVTNKGMSQVTRKDRRRQAQGKQIYLLLAVVRCRHTGAN